MSLEHFISIHDITKDEFNHLMDLGFRLKKETKMGIAHPILKGKVLGMIFTKSSTRTRISFETGMYQLGGYPIFLSSHDIQLGRGESIYDTANVLSRFLDGIMIRTYKHSDVTELAENAAIPVINGLTDLLHPCQVLADLLTISEYKGDLKGKKLCYVGDGNNMAHSLLYGCTKVGMDISIATPDKYKCDETVMNNALKIAAETGSKVEFTNNPKQAMENADAVYTDTWVSMGMEAEKQQRIKDFAGFEVNRELMDIAKPDAMFLHCLPAYRGYEVSADVIDGKQSAIFDEAENRLHAQKAVMATLMK